MISKKKVSLTTEWLQPIYYFCHCTIVCTPCTYIEEAIMTNDFLLQNASVSTRIAVITVFLSLFFSLCNKWMSCGLPLVSPIFYCAWFLSLYLYNVLEQLQFRNVHKRPFIIKRTMTIMLFLRQMFQQEEEMSDGW